MKINNIRKYKEFSLIKRTIEFNCSMQWNWGYNSQKFGMSSWGIDDRVYAKPIFDGINSRGYSKFKIEFYDKNKNFLYTREF